MAAVCYTFHIRCLWQFTARSAQQDSQPSRTVRATADTHYVPGGGAASARGLCSSPGEGQARCQAVRAQVVQEPPRTWNSLRTQLSGVPTKRTRPAPRHLEKPTAVAPSQVFTATPLLPANTGHLPGGAGGATLPRGRKRASFILRSQKQSWLLKS